MERKNKTKLIAEDFDRRLRSVSRVRLFTAHLQLTDTYTTSCVNKVSINGLRGLDPVSTYTSTNPIRSDSVRPPHPLDPRDPDTQRERPGQLTLPVPAPPDD